MIFLEKQKPLFHIIVNFIDQIALLTFKWAIVVARILNAKHVHVLIPRTCQYVRFHGKDKVVDGN